MLRLCMRTGGAVKLVYSCFVTLLHARDSEELVNGGRKAVCLCRCEQNNLPHCVKCNIVVLSSPDTAQLPRHCCACVVCLYEPEFELS